MVKTEFARIIIDPDVEHSPLAASIRRNARNVEVTVQPTAEFAAGTRHLSLTEGKRLLLLRPFRGRAVKFRYSTQADVAPPTFILFCNFPKDVPAHYIRYIQNSFRSHWGFVGTPLRIRIRDSKGS